MVRRNPAARFMGGHWVFPGGAVDAADGEGQAGLQAAGVRELLEETGLRPDAAQPLIPLARWITPKQAPIRFDTWFYLARAEADATPEVDGTELVDFCWITPMRALQRAAAGELKLAFPTERQLERLAGFDSVAGLMADTLARVEQIRPIEPIMIGTGPDARIVLPDDVAGEIQ